MKEGFMGCSLRISSKTQGKFSSITLRLSASQSETDKQQQTALGLWEKSISISINQTS
jgi:hypothetical protein